VDRQRSEAPADDGTGSGFTPSCNLRPSCGRHKQLDDDAERAIGATRHYLDDAEQLLRTETTAVDFFNARIERYPNTWRGRTLGPAPARSTVCANTPKKTSARSSSPPGFES